MPLFHTSLSLPCPSLESRNQFDSICYTCLMISVAAVQPEQFWWDLIMHFSWCWCFIDSVIDWMPSLFYCLGIRKSIRLVKNLSNEVLTWLSVWSEMQVISIWSNWYQSHPVISWFIKIQIGLTFLVSDYPGCPGKEAIKQASVCVLVWLIFAMNLAVKLTQGCVGIRTTKWIVAVMVLVVVIVIIPIIG